MGAWKGIQNCTAIFAYCRNTKNNISHTFRTHKYVRPNGVINLRLGRAIRVNVWYITRILLQLH